MQFLSSWHHLRRPLGSGQPFWAGNLCLQPPWAKAARATIFGPWFGPPRKMADFFGDFAQATAVHKLYPGGSAIAGAAMSGPEFMDKLATLPLLNHP